MPSPVYVAAFGVVLILFGLTIYARHRMLRGERERDMQRLLAASPPCQDYSVAGRRQLPPREQARRAWPWRIDCGPELRDRARDMRWAGRDAVGMPDVERARLILAAGWKS